MEIAEHVEAVRREGELLAGAVGSGAAHAGVTVTVTGCRDVLACWLSAVRVRWS